MADAKRFLENDIKALVLEKLKARRILNPGDCVISEFTVDNHTRRTDLLLVRRKDIWAVEIKSEFDSLVRLEEQVKTYSSFFDKVIVVCAQKHTNSVLNISPMNIEVWELNQQNHIRIVRRGKIAKVVDKQNLLRLFKVSELRKLAREIGTYDPSATKRQLLSILSRAPLVMIRNTIIDGIRSRYKLTSMHFWENTKNTAVSTKTIKLLSKNTNKKIVQVDCDMPKWL
ncbi:sce7726 family protein [Alteromonas sp. PRIM-21]|uniref:sce7726 family protein n=1 Tax=Alteromonas sp. PRIM-21 TaxID=1454978 RepID=UPI0022B9A8DF|nr:sce7726 family protein [Alteromonas sp. PRIM-21]MCZ8529859.1 sce7726 family protein [Alteromonas sp. PRIM-21]